ncbi:MAG TPA: symmetrical bis(5'-nucleosyl)-tetraphosphatase [Burkholderiaceae bacterium]|nr:symmetrical bis(5'-nucleosyl)-tetraphosphatase [Burkholderiaceae bacterium]
MAKAKKSIWAIGDVQGCLPSLKALLAHPEIANDANAHFWFAGDLINRGPDSAGTLRYIKSLGDRATAVLGNHDLHFLGLVAGLRDHGKRDSLHTLIKAPDADELIYWLRQRPMVHYEAEHLLVHAGVLPSWDLTTTLALAQEVETTLRADNWATQIEKVFGNKPLIWDDSLKPQQRLRFIINAFTRMRLCTPEGALVLGKNSRKKNKTTAIPWFDVQPRAIANQATVVFGHWSVLGLLLRPNVICLDTGCVWGRELSALRLHDRRLVQVKCPSYQSPSES